MKLIRHILGTKGYVVWTISPDAPVFDALQMMSDHNLGALVVLEDGKIVGIISERDYARKVILKGKASKETLVREIMTSPAILVTPEQTVESCMALMVDKHIRHLPVVEGDRLIGIVSIGDLVNITIGEQRELIRQLENFILEHKSLT
jgi:CBS domain-containing protein